MANGQSISDHLAKDLAEHTRKRLPRYAVPLFLRLRKHVEVTGTLKHQKVQLRNEGVEHEKIGGDEIFWLPPGSDRYKPFGSNDWQRIVSGEAKL